MRVIVWEERPHPGVQPRLTGLDGHRITAFAAGAHKGQLAGLELRRRQRARCEDRTRNVKDAGLRNLHLKGFARNRNGPACACPPPPGGSCAAGRRLRLRPAERWP